MGGSSSPVLEKDWGLDFPREELLSALGETRLAHTSLDLSPTRGAHVEGAQVGHAPPERKPTRGGGGRWAAAPQGQATRDGGGGGPRGGGPDRVTLWNNDPIPDTGRRSSNKRNVSETSRHNLNKKGESTKQLTETMLVCVAEKTPRFQGSSQCKKKWETMGHEIKGSQLSGGHSLAHGVLKIARIECLTEF